MYLKLFGAVLIISGCGAWGFHIAFSQRLEFRCLKQLLQSLDYMQCELQYHLTPLPQLCRDVAKQYSGIFHNFWYTLSQELEDQIAPDVFSCLKSALAKVDLPPKAATILNDMAMTLGRFDLEGQVSALESARQACRMQIQRLEADFIIRQRSCQTLGLCAGAALAILLL